MVEAAISSIGCKILSTIASPAFKAAYEKGRSIWEARDELDKLAVSIETIQAVLCDAEKKKEGSAAIRNWIQRVSDVLYNADDLFDEVATDELLKQQLKGDKLLKKVRAYSIKLNPIVSRNSIANQVKAIRKTLAEISNDMAQFNFVEFVDKQLISERRKQNDLGSYVDSKNIIGREDDKKVILEMLSDDKSNNSEKVLSVIAIVGIGGMGKTTLVQLVYNDKEVENRFKMTWFACISDASDDREVIGKIFQSVCDQKSYSDVTLDKLQSEIRQRVKDKKFLLVLDDVWDDDHGKWIHRMSLLIDCAKGSKIIVTTRSVSVAKAVGALEAQTHNLKGLSESKSWDLFKRVALTQEQEKDPRWTNLGKEIVKKCVNVPLAIRSVGSLLYTKDTIQEWEYFKDNELLKIGLGGDLIMQTLKLSYDHLPFNLKPCFAYCSHLPKDYVFNMEDLIYLWIAQGYVKPIDEMQMVEQAGYSYFMDLVRRSFFERVKYPNRTSRKEYKMHDLIHDLTQCVAGEEITVLTKPTSQFNKRARHVTIGDEVDTSHMLNSDRLRSLILLPRKGRNVEGEDRQIFTYGKCLRVLSLSRLRIHYVSSCIGELKHLRYLNLSHNLFENLPDSLTNLLNLLTLDISGCLKLKALPDSFRKLIKLRHLNIHACYMLKHMPPRMGELTCLQNLSDFKVGKAIEGVQMSGLDELPGVQLRGELVIQFEEGIDSWHEDECWKLPAYLESLDICFYLGSRIPNWSNHPSFLPNLSFLSLSRCRKVKYLPPLRCLPNLKFLRLDDLYELEYIEEDKGCSIVAAGFINNTFFPLLEELRLSNLLQLKGWSRMKVEATPIATSAGSPSPDLFLFFPLLSKLTIQYCYELASFPLCPCIRTLQIDDVDGGLMQHFLSESLEELTVKKWKGLVNFPDKAFPDLLKARIIECQSLENLRLLASPLLKYLEIRDCAWLTSVEVKDCKRIKSLHIARLNALQELYLWGIQQEEKRFNVDWDSLPNLRKIYIPRIPEELPDHLLRRLKINPRVNRREERLPNSLQNR